MEVNKETEKLNETIVDEIDSDKLEVKEPTVTKATHKDFSKNEEAKRLMKEAEEIITSVDNEVEEIHGIVAEHVSAFENEKSSLSGEVFSKVLKQFETLNHTYSREDVDAPFEVTLGTNKEKLQVSNLGTGRFSGLLLGFVGMVGTAAAWMYVGSQKTATVLDESLLKPEVLQNLQNNEQLKPMFEWIGGGMTGGAGNSLFGMATVGVTSLLIGFFLYKIRVSMKENKNFKIANQTREGTESYVERQQESRSEIEKVDRHLEEVTPLVTNYTVLLTEQSAKLNRIIHIEGADEEQELHSTSKDIIANTEELMRKVEKLIITPMTQEGRVNEASVEAYNEAKATYDEYLQSLYS